MSLNYKPSSEPLHISVKELCWKCVGAFRVGLWPKHKTSTLNQVLEAGGVPKFLATSAKLIFEYPYEEPFVAWSMPTRDIY